jgi:hypothetical protein
MRAALFITLSLLIATTLTLPSDASACINGMKEEAPMVGRDGKANYASVVRDATRFLERQYPVHALAIIANHYEEFTQLTPIYKTPSEIVRRGNSTHDERLTSRAAQIAAIAIIRTYGEVSFQKKPTVSKKGAQMRLEWATSVIAHQLAQSPEDVALQNYAAEALAAQEGKRDEALSAFNALDDQRKLLPSSRVVQLRLRDNKPGYDRVAQIPKLDLNPPQTKGARVASEPVIDDGEGIPRSASRGKSRSAAASPKGL